MFVWVKALKTNLTQFILKGLKKYIEKNPLEKEERIKYTVFTIVKCIEAKYHFKENSPCKLEFVDADILDVCVEKSMQALADKGIQVLLKNKRLYIEKRARAEETETAAPL
jgi:hypothetical protein